MFGCGLVALGSRGLSNLMPLFLLSPRYPLVLLGAFCFWFAAWAVNPPHPDDFLLEHALTVVFIGFLLWNHSRFRLSNISYTLIFLFLCLHVVGAHYTYAEVPYPAWCARAAAWIGKPGFDVQAFFGFSRNHYDRLVHFSFGLLMAYPVREIFIRIARVRGFWGYYLPWDVMMSFSMVYELIEWWITLLFAADIGQSYLGSQGDVWDAQKDMGLATLGGLIAMTVAALINSRLKRDFAAEFIESLRPRDSAPLGEVAIRKMLEDKDRPRA